MNSEWRQAMQRLSTEVQMARLKNWNHHQACPVFFLLNVIRKERCRAPTTDQRPDAPIRRKQDPYLSSLIVEPYYESWSFLMSPSRKLMFSTYKLLNIRSTIVISILFLSFLHPTKKKEDITTHQQCKILRARSFQEEVQIFSSKFYPIYKRVQSPGVYHSKVQSLRRQRDTFNPQISSEYLIISLHASWWIRSEPSHSIHSTNLERPLDQKPTCVIKDQIRTVVLNSSHQPRALCPFKKATIIWPTLQQTCI